MKRARHCNRNRRPASASGVGKKEACGGAFASEFSSSDDEKSRRPSGLAFEDLCSTGDATLPPLHEDIPILCNKTSVETGEYLRVTAIPRSGQGETDLQTRREHKPDGGTSSSVERIPGRGPTGAITGSTPGEYCTGHNDDGNFGSAISVIRRGRAACSRNVRSYYSPSNREGNSESSFYLQPVESKEREPFPASSELASTAGKAGGCNSAKWPAGRSELRTRFDASGSISTRTGSNILESEWLSDGAPSSGTFGGQSRDASGFQSRYANGHQQHGRISSQSTNFSERDRADAQSNDRCWRETFREHGGRTSEPRTNARVYACEEVAGGNPELYTAKPQARISRGDIQENRIPAQCSGLLSKDENGVLSEGSESAGQIHAGSGGVAEGCGTVADYGIDNELHDAKQERFTFRSPKGEKNGELAIQDSLDAFMNTLEFSESKSYRSRIVFGEELDNDCDGVATERHGATLNRQSTSNWQSRSSNIADSRGRIVHVVGDENDCSRPRVDDEDDDDDEDDALKDFPDEKQTKKVYQNDLVLPAVDHAAISYEPIAKNIYVPLPRLRDITQDDIHGLFAALGTSANGSDDLQAPIARFQDLALTMPQALFGALLSSFPSPTTVQRVSFPTILSGSDAIVIAETGSGKTLAYALPSLVHIYAQKHRQIGIARSGPSALIVAPTRELAIQITSVVRELGRVVNIGVGCIVGGFAKYEQFKQLRDGGIGLVVCTPGRFIDLIRMKACYLSSVTYLALDEADRMFDMGFGPQIKTILSQIRPDAQKVFVSATFPQTIRKLAKSFLNNAVHIVVASNRDDRSRNCEGAHSDKSNPSANDDIGRKISQYSSSKSLAVPLVPRSVSESYVLVRSERERLPWLRHNLAGMLHSGMVLVFCATRGGAAELTNELRMNGQATGCIHGETEEHDRVELMKLFRRGEIRLLVATDIAARGLDVAGVRTVVNFEPAKNWDDHIHRSGRTGRAGASGNVFTLLNVKAARDAAFVQSACSALRAARVEAPPALSEALAQIRDFDQKDSKRIDHRKKRKVRNT